MKAKELRIGNYFYLKADGHENEICKVTVEDFDFYDWENQTEPIPLTEEWLLKFGFKEDGVLYTLRNRDHFSVKSYYKENIDWVIFQGQRNVFYRNKLHVHQLQNLYFALTGEELEIKNK